MRGFVRQLAVKNGAGTLEYTLPVASSELSLDEEKERVRAFEYYGGGDWIRTSEARQCDRFTVCSD